MAIVKHVLVVLALLGAAYVGAVLAKRHYARVYFDGLEAEIRQVHAARERLLAVESGVDAGAAAKPAAEAQRAEVESFLFQLIQVRQHREYAHRKAWNLFYNFTKHDILPPRQAG